MIDRWDPRIKVEESAYNWHKEPLLLTPAGPPPEGRPVLVDLFCGAGGLSLGFKRAGFHVALGIDVHVPSIRTFVHNHPESAALLGDLRKIPEGLVSEALGGKHVDVVAGGVPCQGFSRANRKRSTHDERNYLFWEFKRIVELLNPAYVLIENVTGLKSMDNGSFVVAIEDALSEAGGGYRVEHRLLNAADFGVPQTRERIFFLGARRPYPLLWPHPTRGADKGVSHVTVRESLGDLPPLRPGESRSEYVSEPLTAYQTVMRMGDPPLMNHEAPRHPRSTVERIRRTAPGEPMYKTFKQRIRLDPNRPSPTLISGGIRPQFSFGHPWEPRGMSVRERARLMGFPDSFEFPCGIVMGRVLTGQAVPPLLAEAVARSIHRGLGAKRFREQLMPWFATEARAYPWRRPESGPYQVLIAEMLLRKTRADAVVPVWQRLVERYPDPESLARADTAGLERDLHEIGLSRIRAEALIHLADSLVRKHMGMVPPDIDALTELPEVGPYIANATLCFGFGKRRPILDANVHRVHTRIFGLPEAKELHKATAHWNFAEQILPEREFREYNLALLDFAAKICTSKNPRCPECFAQEYCEYYARFKSGLSPDSGNRAPSTNPDSILA